MRKEQGETVSEPGLTLTEAGVARLAANGQKNEQIADLLAIQPSTVQNHLARVYRKLGVRSRTELLLLLGAAQASERGGSPDRDAQVRRK